MSWTIQHIDESVNAADFDCGEPSLNSFLQKHALQNHRSGLGRTYVALGAASRLDGFYTLSAGSVTFNLFPDHEKHRLPRYPIPTIHLGRLAVSLQCQGAGLGKTLLVDAITKAAAASSGIGVFAIDVFALNDRAKSFYLKYGFVEMLDLKHHLFLSMKVARRLVQNPP